MAAMMLILKCLTNLHVGNGDVNYNIIDNEVERDPVTNYPTINASGVKGALRAYLKDQVAPRELEQWLGSKEGTQAGRLKILQASMLAMPLRMTEGNEPYKLVYTKEMQEQYEELASVFHIQNILGNEQAADPEMRVEGYPLTGKRELVLPGGNGQPNRMEPLYKMENANFASCDLPVLARNCLEDGKSVNLWYEEVVPHKSIFYIPVVADEKDKPLLGGFKAAVDGKVIQFGGNASIGYGLCKVFVMEGTV